MSVDQSTQVEVALISGAGGKEGPDKTNEMGLSATWAGAPSDHSGEYREHASSLSPGKKKKESLKPRLCKSRSSRSSRSLASAHAGGGRRGRHALLGV